jgi:hypothetical protein
MELNDVNLARYIIELQDLMRLNDCDVYGEIIDDDHIKLKGIDGCVHGYYESQRTLNKYVIFVNKDVVGIDWMLTVTHEMVHIVCDNFLGYLERKKPLNDFGNSIFEMMIEKLAVGFCNAWANDECLLGDG